MFRCQWELVFVIQVQFRCRSRLFFLFVPPPIDIFVKLEFSEKYLIFHSDGNGGLYKALIPYLDFFYETGVKYFHVYCVDNVLCRVADPHFLGYCIKKQADCAAKVRN